MGTPRSLRKGWRAAARARKEKVKLEAVIFHREQEGIPEDARMLAAKALDLYKNVMEGKVHRHAQARLSAAEKLREEFCKPAAKAVEVDVGLRVSFSLDTSRADPLPLVEQKELGPPAEDTPLPLEEKK